MTRLYYSVGDSLTHGIDPETVSWPAYLGAMRGVTVTNLGISGSSLSGYGTGYLATPPVAYVTGGILMVCIATNDFGLNGFATVSEIFALLQAYIAARRQDGWQVYVLPVPRRFDGTAPEYATWDSRWPEYNALLRSTYGAIDTTQDNRIGDAAAYDTTYYLGDRTHFTVAGYQVMAEWADATIPPFPTRFKGPPMMHGLRMHRRAFS